MSILNNDDPTDMTKVLKGIEEDSVSFHNDSESQTVPMTQDQVIALVVSERDYWREEARKDREALKTFVAYCKEKGLDPFADESSPLNKPLSEFTKEELAARNEEATQRIARTRHVDSKDKIPMPNWKEESEIYKENPEITQLMDLMDKLKSPPQKADAPRKPWWKVLFASSHDPIDPSEEDGGHSSFRPGSE